MLPLQHLTHIIFLYGQGHSSLEHWPKLIYSVTTIMEKSRSEVMPLAAQGMDAGDLQLLHCFQNLRVTTKHIHKNKFLHNFASTGFHLCYLLKVCA